MVLMRRSDYARARRYDRGRTRSESARRRSGRRLDLVA